MRTHPFRTALVVAAAFAASISAQSRCRRRRLQRPAQAAASPPGRQTGRHPQTKRSNRLSGVWLRRAGIVNIADLLPKGETLPFLPETLKRMSLLNLRTTRTACSLATPRSSPYPFRFVETPARIFILAESVHAYRQLFMDGRTHPPADDLQQSWQGHSIGRWDGDTLVVDTVGFNDLTWFDNYGHVHSDKIHLA